MSKAVLVSDDLHISERDYLSASWLIFSFTSVQIFRIGMIKWIGVSLAFGAGGVLDRIINLFFQIPFYPILIAE